MYTACLQQQQQQQQQQQKQEQQATANYANQMKHTITLLILPAPRRWAKKNTVNAPLGSGHKVAVNLLECHDTAAVLAPENLDIQSTTTTPYV